MVNRVGDRPDQYRDAVHTIKDRDGKSPRGRRTLHTYSGGDMPDDNAVEIGFAKSGDYTQDEGEFVAKYIKTDRTCVYFVLFSTHGYDVGRMLNPYSMYFKPEDLTAFNGVRGRPNYEFKRVGKAAFEEYLLFLSTRLDSHLRTAERMVLDA